MGAAVVSGIGGFGTGVILAAVLAPLIGIKAVIPVLAVAGVVINAGRFWFYRASLERRTLGLVLACSIPFLVLGTWIYTILDVRVLGTLLGLVVIFVYAFFKFAWSYRLFNYVAIMIGAAPPIDERDTPAAKEFVHRAAMLCRDAGRHFNRGQRAFFFALGYLGWFIGPAILIATTTGVVVVMWRRQFASESRQAFLGTAAG